MHYVILNKVQIQTFNGDDIIELVTKRHFTMLKVESAGVYGRIG